MPPSFSPLTSLFYSLPFQPVIFLVPFPMATLSPISSDPFTWLEGAHAYTLQLAAQGGEDRCNSMNGDL